MAIEDIYQGWRLDDRVTTSGQPTETDFSAFCAANYRGSASLCRYRRDRLGVDAAKARADMEKVWQPDPVWARFLAV